MDADGVISAADLMLVRNRIRTGFVAMPLRTLFSESAVEGQRLMHDVLA